MARETNATFKDLYLALRDALPRDYTGPTIVQRCHAYKESSNVIKTLGLALSGNSTVFVDPDDKTNDNVDESRATFTVEDDDLDES